MKKIIETHSGNTEIRTHIDNGLHSTKIVYSESTMYVENGRIYIEEKHNGKVVSLEDVTEHYNLDGTEKY